MGSDFSVESSLLSEAFAQYLNSKTISIIDEDLLIFRDGIINAGNHILQKHNCKQGFLVDGIGEAINIGQSHGYPGDILLTLIKNKNVFIELKFGGKGTLANISQNALTNLGIFTGVPSWQEYRNEKGCIDYISKELCCGNTQSMIEDSGRKLRELALKDDIDAIQKIERITNYANLNKIEYCALLQNESKFNINKGAMFASAMFRGIHKSDSLTRYLQNEDGEHEIDYSIIFMKEGGFKIHTPPDKKWVFPEYSPGAGGFFITADSQNLLYIKFHYKNVFQGIATPCLNIFDYRFK